MSTYCQILLNVILHAAVIGIWLAVPFGLKPYESGFHCDDERIGTILKPYKEGCEKLYSGQVISWVKGSVRVLI